MRLVWLIDVPSRNATVHRLDGTFAAKSSGDSLDGETVLPGFLLPLDELFPQ